MEYVLTVIGVIFVAVLAYKILGKDKVKSVTDEALQLAINVLMDQGKMLGEEGKKYFNEKILSKIDEVKDKMREMGKDVKEETAEAFKEYIKDVNEKLKDKVEDKKEELKDKIEEVKEDIEEKVEEIKGEYETLVITKVKENPIYIKLNNLERKIRHAIKE
ncbi:MAG: YtxH domain-containing protein [Methanofastidiosum sp.]